MRKPGPKPSIPDSKVREIRGQWAEWKAMGCNKGYGTLAVIYGCSASTVRDFITGRTRRDA